MKMYILVNQDLKMGKGKIAGQVAHVVMRWSLARMGWELTEFSHKGKQYGIPLELGKNEPILDDYLKGDETKIILKAPQYDLEYWEAQGYVSVNDLGKTQIEAGSLTAVCFGILEEEDVPEFIKNLPLL